MIVTLRPYKIGALIYAKYGKDGNRAFAEDTGYSRQSLSAKMKKRSCRFETAMKLANALDVDVKEIIEEGEGHGW